VTDHHTPVSDAEALLYDCPLCGQLAGSSCVYAPLVTIDLYSRSAAQQAKLAKVGTPTNKPHNERRAVIHNMRYREFRQLIDDKLKQRKHTVREALVLWDAQENKRLHDWLSQYGSILW
jgi:hypothetical protein